jgi:hypothetical protein
MGNVLIIGATSAVAQAFAQIWADEKHDLYLIARNGEYLDRIANDLQIRSGLTVHTAVLDVLDYDCHLPTLKNAISTLGQLDVVLVAHGSLGDQHAHEQNYRSALQEIHVNATSVIVLLTHLANIMESQQRGVIAVISSVAGDRGRQSNYVYGAAKGAVTIFLEGLRQRMYKSGIHVLTVKPGFVDTPMTKDRKKGFLWVGPERVARDISRGIQKRKDEIYSPWFWKYIMIIIRVIPAYVFKRISL